MIDSLASAVQILRSEGFAQFLVEGNMNGSVVIDEVVKFVIN